MTKIEKTNKSFKGALFTNLVLAIILFTFSFGLCSHENFTSDSLLSGLITFMTLFSAISVMLNILFIWDNLNVHKEDDLKEDTTETQDAE